MAAKIVKGKVRPSCGARCLAQAAGRLGVSLGEDEAGALADERPGQASMAGLMRAAAAKGLIGRPEQWTLLELAARGNGLAGQVLLHFPAGDGHFMLFEHFDGRTCQATDPSTLSGEVQIPLDKLERWWDGKVLVIEKAAPAAKGAVAATSGKAVKVAAGGVKKRSR